MSALDVFIRILVAAALGGVIGFEREIRERRAGFRTHILVSVGAAAFTLASSYGLDGAFDPNRVAAGVVTGIGFLGAGAIIRYGASVHGLTTAASIWAVASVGLLSAKGFYSAALITAGMVMVGLYLMRLVEDWVLYPIAGQPVAIKVQFRTTGYSPLTKLTTALDEVHVVVKEMTVSDDDQNDTIHLLLRVPRRLKSAQVLALVAKLDEVRDVVLE